MYVHYYNYWYQALYGINQARAQRVPGVWAERDMGYIRMYVIHTIYPMPRMPQAIPPTGAENETVRYCPFVPERNRLYTAVRFTHHATRRLSDFVHFGARCTSNEPELFSFGM